MRNWDSIRTILLTVEQMTESAWAGGVEYPTPQQVMMQAIDSMGDGRQARAGDWAILRDPRYVVIGDDCSWSERGKVLCLTNEGYELLDSIRDDAMWEAIKAAAIEGGVKCLTAGLVMDMSRRISMRAAFAQ